jgi:hypothetical protein
MSSYPPQSELWVIGAPFTQNMDTGYSVSLPHAYVAIRVREGTQTVQGNTNYPRARHRCAWSEPTPLRSCSSSQGVWETAARIARGATT